MNVAKEGQLCQTQLMGRKKNILSSRNKNSKKLNNLMLTETSIFNKRKEQAEEQARSAASSNPVSVRNSTSKPASAIVGVSGTPSMSASAYKKQSQPAKLTTTTMAT